MDALPSAHPSSPRGADAARYPDAAGQDAARPDASGRGYWEQVPAFQRAWAEHVRRWPAGRAATVLDRSGDRAGSWRGDGNQYLDPGQHAQARDVIAGVQRAERGLTGHIEQVERDNGCDGRLAGTQFRLKGEQRLKEKIAERIEHAPGTTPADAARRINDAIRYTFCFEPHSYTGGYREVRQHLEARDYRMTYSQNHWQGNPEYKGINTRWVAPDGCRFELQFHTPESTTPSNRSPTAPTSASATR